MQDLNIILPVYNEKDSIELLLEEWIPVLEKEDISFSFIITEDGSVDGTKELLPKLTKKFPIILDQKNERRGYTRAVLDGISISQSKYILSIDSDGQCDPGDFNAIWERRNQHDVIIGWRKPRADNVLRKIYSALFKVLFKSLFPVKIHDPSAPYVLYKKNDINQYFELLSYMTEGFWWGFIGVCFKYNMSILEIPVNHRKRLVGATNVYSIRKLPMIAVRNIIGLFKIRFSN